MGGDADENYLHAMRSKTKKHNWQMHVTSAQIQGQRDHQEDRFLITRIQGVELLLLCDGHGGDVCVDFVMKQFPVVFEKELQSKKSMSQVLKDVVRQMHEQWSARTLGSSDRYLLKTKNVKQEQAEIFKHIKWEHFQQAGFDSGTTLLACVLDTSKGLLYICHLGDSRAVVSSGSGVWASLDHAVPKKLTVETKEGKVPVPISEGRLAGDLGMRASIGDYSPEMVGFPQVIPDIHTIRLSSVHPTTLIMGSDGLYDRVDQSLLFLNPHVKAKDIIDEFGEDTFEDNTTIIYVQIIPVKVLDKSTATSTSKSTTPSTSTSMSTKSPKLSKVPKEPKVSKFPLTSKNSSPRQKSPKHKQSRKKSKKSKKK